LKVVQPQAAALTKIRSIAWIIAAAHSTPGLADWNLDIFAAGCGKDKTPHPSALAWPPPDNGLSHLRSAPSRPGSMCRRLCQSDSTGNEAADLPVEQPIKFELVVEPDYGHGARLGIARRALARIRLLHLLTSGCGTTRLCPDVRDDGEY
jgi:hypothetical protein